VSKIEIAREAAQEQLGAQEPAAPERLLTRAEVLARIPITYPTLWQWTREGRFPPPRYYGSRTFWLASEIDGWIRDMPVRKFKPLTPTK
jgi:predicted DNA-binding transcriptional regulator AlpA